MSFLAQQGGPFSDGALVRADGNSRIYLILDKQKRWVSSAESFQAQGFFWDDDGWTMQREFDWADHVNEYWDEALNVNAYDWLLRHRMADRLADLCPRYWRDPTIYTIEDEGVLQDRYAHLGMRDTKSMRLGELCQGDMGKRDEMILAANDAP